MPAQSIEDSSRRKLGPRGTTLGQSAKLGTRFCSNDMNSASPFTAVPNDMLSTALGFLPAVDLANAGLCGSGLRAVAISPCLWADLCGRRIDCFLAEGGEPSLGRYAWLSPDDNNYFSAEHGLLEDFTAPSSTQGRRRGRAHDGRGAVSARAQRIAMSAMHRLGLAGNPHQWVLFYQALDLLCLVGVWQRLPADCASDCRGELLGIGLTDPRKPDGEAMARGSESSENSEFSENLSTTTTTSNPKLSTPTRSASEPGRITSSSSKWRGGLVAHACAPNGGRDVKFTIAVAPDPTCLRRLKVSPRLPACNPRVAPVLGARPAGPGNSASGATAGARAGATVGPIGSSFSSYRSNSSAGCMWSGSGRDGLELRLLGVASTSRFGSRSPRCASSLPRSTTSSFDSSSSSNDARKSSTRFAPHQQTASPLRFHVRHLLSNRHYAYVRLPGPFPAQDRFVVPAQSAESHSTSLGHPHPVGAFPDVLALSAQHHMVQDIPLLASTFRRLHQQPQDQQDQQPQDQQAQEEQEDQQREPLGPHKRQQKQHQHPQQVHSPAVGSLETLRGLWVAPYGSHGLEIVHLGTCHEGLHRSSGSALKHRTRSIIANIERGQPSRDHEELDDMTTTTSHHSSLGGGFTLTSTNTSPGSHGNCSRDWHSNSGEPSTSKGSAQRHPLLKEEHPLDDQNSSLEPTVDGVECLRLEGLKVVGDPNVPSGKLSFVVDGSRRYDPRERLGLDDRLVVAFPPAGATVADLNARLPGIVSWYRGQGQINPLVDGAWEPEWVGIDVIVYDPVQHPRVGFSVLWDEVGEATRHIMDFAPLDLSS